MRSHTHVLTSNHSLTPPPIYPSCVPPPSSVSPVSPKQSPGGTLMTAAGSVASPPCPLPSTSGSQPLGSHLAEASLAVNTPHSRSLLKACVQGNTWRGHVQWDMTKGQFQFISAPAEMVHAATTTASDRRTSPVPPPAA